MHAWTYQLAEAPVEHLQVLACAAPDLEASAVDDAEEVEDDAAVIDAGAEGGAAPPTPPLEPEAADEAPPPLPVAEPQAVPPASGYVVSLSRTDWRKLHRLGGCARLPGVHYLRFELLGDARPGPEAYDDFCRQCWKSGGPEEETDEEESETEAEDAEVPIFVEDPLGLGAPGADVHI